MVSANWTWQSVFYSLNQWGLSDILLPFLLIFTIIFAVLQKTKILGKESKKYNIIVSFVMAFMFVMPHVLHQEILGYDPVALINSVLPTVSVLVVAVVLLLILVGVFAYGEYQGARGFFGFIVIVSIIVLVYVFGAAAGWWYGWNWLNNLLGGSDTIAILVMLIVFGIIIAFVTGGEEEGRKTSGDKFMDKFDKLFK